MSPSRRQVRAVFDERTITVYQAYSAAIANPALDVGSFVHPFRRERMTWIKPSFLWMMYRSGWATKPGQERVLAIRITREGFEEALSLACLSHFDPTVYADHAAWETCKTESPVRVQWDPERTRTGEPLPWRSLQVGLGGEAVGRYVDDWTVDITDITPSVVHLRGTDPDPAQLPPELPYPLPADLATTIGADRPCPRGEPSTGVRSWPAADAQPPR